jgi:hypothetical protein
MVPVPAKGSRGSKLPQFVADHIFRNENGNVFSPVMDRYGMSHHLGKYGGSPGPCLNNPFISCCVHALDFCQQLGIRKWSFL